MASGAALTEASQSPAPVAHQTLHATALPALTSVSSDAFTVRVTKPTEEVQRIDGWKNQYSRGQFGVGTCSLLSSSHLPSGQAACRGLAAQSGRAMHDPRSASQFQAPACGGSGGCRGDDSVTPIRTAKECRPLKCKGRIHAHPLSFSTPIDGKPPRRTGQRQQGANRRCSSCMQAKRSGCRDARSKQKVVHARRLLCRHTNASIIII